MEMLKGCEPMLPVGTFWVRSRGRLCEDTGLKASWSFCSSPLSRYTTEAQHDESMVKSVDSSFANVDGAPFIGYSSDVKDKSTGLAIAIQIICAG